jgi:uncharacterized protein YjbJ (UPF0337 family)
MAFEFLKNLFGGGASKAMEALENAKDAVSDKVGDLNLDNITSSVSDKFTEMKDAVADKIEDAQAAVSEKVGDLNLDNITASVSEKFTEMKDAVADKIEDAQAAMGNPSDLMNQAKDKFAEIKDSVQDKIEDLTGTGEEEKPA